MERRGGERPARTATHAGLDITVVLRSGDVVPMDGEAIEGQAVVDEAAVTGESAPVLREAVPGHHTVLAGTRVTSGWLRVRPLTAPVLRQAARRRLAAWWPAVVLGLAAAWALLTRAWTGWPRAAAVAILAIPVLSLAARAAAAAVQRRFWGTLRVLPLAARPLERAARCNTLLLSDGAVDAAGRLVAVAFHALPPAAPAEVAAAAHRAGLADEGRIAHSVHILAQSRGLQAEAALIREPVCGPVAEVARQVAIRGGAWPEEARVLEADIAARGARCLAAADGARPLGLVELRAAATWPTLDDALAAGLSLSILQEPRGLAAAAAELRAQGRAFAVACEGTGGGAPPPGATFVLASTAWGAARPTALDLDANVGKLPALVLGARRLRARLRALATVAIAADAVRAAAVVRVAVLALRGPAPRWGVLNAAAMGLVMATTTAALAAMASLERRAAG